MKFDNKNIERAMGILEVEITNYIRSKGGSALQSQIQQDLGFNDGATMTTLLAVSIFQKQ